MADIFAIQEKNKEGLKCKVTKSPGLAGHIASKKRVKTLLLVFIKKGNNL